MLRVLVFLLLAGSSAGQDLRLPKPPVKEPPAPIPGQAFTLPSGQMLAFDSDTEYLYRTIPDGMVTVTKSKGPMTISAIMAVSGQRERKTFEGKFVYEVEPLNAKGRVTLVLIKVGATTDADIVSVPIDVNGGQAPQPPPPNPTPVAGKLFGVIVIEPSTTVWGQRAATIAAADSWCVENKVNRRWVYDNVIGPDGLPPTDMKPWLDRAKGKDKPYVYLVTDKGGILFEGPAPQDPTGFTTLLNSHKGG